MLRIGEGYDVHAFANDRDLILGGVKIPYELGLIGHSDADVLIHSIMDSLLGAFALYDIGKYFNDKDPSYKNINSMQLLRYVDAICKKYIYDFKNVIDEDIYDNMNIPNYVMDKNGYDLLLNDENIKGIKYIVNIDTTVVCQNPKLSKYIDAIRKNIASVLNINIFQISIKATTEEKLGFTGNMQGIKCKSVCLLCI